MRAMMFLAVVGVLGYVLYNKFHVAHDKISVAPELSDAERLLHFEAHKKSTTAAYILWFFFGWMGAHRIVAGKLGSGLGMAAFSFFMVIFSFTGIGLFMLPVLLIWWVVDLFLISGWVSDYNEKLIKHLGGTSLRSSFAY